MNLFNKLKLVFTLISLFLSLGIFAQSDYDLRLTLDTIDCINKTACYNVQLRSADGTTWGLAGQNYRLYYDGALASWQSGTSTLSTNYQDFTLIQDVQDVDASAVDGSLAFEPNLSFLNYTMDLNNLSTGGVDLPSDGSWVTTSQLCFLLEDSLINDPTTCLEVVWAKDGLTNEYATSFVEVSEWIMANTTQMADGMMYDGLETSDGVGSCITASCFSSGKYDIRMAFDSIDCLNQIGCYNVQLRSADGNNWGLAGQNYRIYYDASLAGWQSGVSLLSASDYQDFTLIQDIQNVNANIGSNLNFEDSLSFLNYTMDLTNLSAGGTTLPTDGSWLTTSQLCFHLEDTLLNNPGACLEAVWARDTLTAAYATSFVEVAEWIMADSIEMADGVLYDDLDPTDGNGSCFNGVCVYDYGDLPDSSAMTNSIDYQTLMANNGPAHLITTGLSLGNLIDEELDGQPDLNALGDGADEDGLTIFPSLDLNLGLDFRLPLNYINTTGNTAHIEAWIDWNGDGDFEDIDEMVLDMDDSISGFPSFLTFSIPATAQKDNLLGFRIRLSNTDNMTPYGRVGAGEVEDYLIDLDCQKIICAPYEIQIKK